MVGSGASRSGIFANAAAPIGVSQRTTLPRSVAVPFLAGWRPEISTWAVTVDCCALTEEAAMSRHEAIETIDHERKYFIRRDTPGRDWRCWRNRGLAPDRGSDTPEFQRKQNVRAQ